MPHADLAVLKPLQDLIERIVRSTPIGATEQLAAELTVRTAAWVGKNVLPRTEGLAAFVVDVDSERQRQLDKFGDQQHPDMVGDPSAQGDARDRFAEWADNYRAINDGNLDPRDPDTCLDWTGILLEEVYEALAESDPAKLRAELIQVAAVCQAWVSDIDRRPPALDCQCLPASPAAPRTYCDDCLGAVAAPEA